MELLVYGLYGLALFHAIVEHYRWSLRRGPNGWTVVAAWSICVMMVTLVLSGRLVWFNV